MDKFTLIAHKIAQYKVFSFKDITLSHYECLSRRIVKRELNPGTWVLVCSKCHRKITVHNDAKGTLPIIQTAIDGVERSFNHDYAVEKVIQKK